MTVRIASRIRDFLHEARGAAAAEFTLVALMFAYMMINVGDLGVYVYDKMQVESAAQAAAESMWAQCSPTTGAAPNITANCSGYAAKITSAAQQTSLGTGVTALLLSSPGEGWYCANTSGGLTRNSTSISGSQPTCTSIVSTDTTKAGDYVPIQASYAYSPIFPGATVTSLLSTTITHTVWIRVY
jgi:Flp pilus assembly protein TadG